MKATEHKLQIYMPRASYRYLKAAAAQRGVSLSAYIRDLLTSEMQNGGSGVPDPLLALLENREGTGTRDASQRVDHHVYGEDR